MKTMTEIYDLYLKVSYYYYMDSNQFIKMLVHHLFINKIYHHVITYNPERLLIDGIELNITEFQYGDDIPRLMVSGVLSSKPYDRMLSFMNEFETINTLHIDCYSYRINGYKYIVQPIHIYQNCGDIYNKIMENRKDQS